MIINAILWLILLHTGVVLAGRTASLAAGRVDRVAWFSILVPCVAAIALMWRYGVLK